MVILQAKVLLSVFGDAVTTDATSTDATATAATATEVKP